MSLWPVNVLLLDDESLSSWLTRVALENGCDPLVMTSVVWPRWRVWTTDIDRGISVERQVAISLRTGVECDSIQRASISLEAKLFSTTSLPRYGVWPWVLGLGTRNRSYRGGVQFCPYCIAEDPIPYFRRLWRFSWVTGCMAHRVQLLDRCVKCLKPIEPHRLEAINAVNLSQCSSCGFDLRDSVSRPILDDAMSFQLQAFAAVRKGSEEVVGQILSTNQWFDVCRHLIVILRRSNSQPDSALAKALYKSGLDTRELPLESLHLQLELLTITAREPLLACLYKLLNNLDIFACNLSSQGAQVNSLMGRQGSLPPALTFLVEQLGREDRFLGAPRKHIFKKPRSDISVIKAWARLKRKYRIG